MKKLTLRNTFFINGNGVTSLAVWLSNQLLHGKESRFRTRFLKIVEPRLAEIDSERVKIAENNAVKKKDKDGVEQIVYLDKDGKDTTEKASAVSYKVKDQEKFDKDYDEYMREEYIIDVTPANSETIFGVRDIILNTKEEFTGVMATMYDEWCEAFENIK